jgi:hypothetical protein
LPSGFEQQIVRATFPKSLEKNLMLMLQLFGTPFEIA